ncbi:MAG: hypothetical protein Q9184_005957 [Pyrenodesmia sp. 2 TL-2023]
MSSTGVASGATSGAGGEPPKKPNNQGEKKGGKKGGEKKEVQPPRPGKDGRCIECGNHAHPGPCWVPCRRCGIRHNWHKRCPSGAVQSTSMALPALGGMFGGAGGPPPEAMPYIAGIAAVAFQSWGMPMTSLPNLKGAAQGVAAGSSKNRPAPDDAPEESGEAKEKKKKKSRWAKKKKAEKKPAADGSGQQQGGPATDQAASTVDTEMTDAPADSNARSDETEPPTPVEKKGDAGQ